MRRRRRLASTACMTCSRDIPESLGPVPIGLKNLVATTGVVAAPLEGLAEQHLRLPLPVGVAVSKKLTRRRRRRRRSAWTPPSPVPCPKVMVPSRPPKP